MKQNTPEDKTYLFDNPKNVTLLLRVFYVLCAVLMLLDFVVHRHIYTELEKIPTFYALYGFVACVVLVVIAKEMRKWLMRDEDYYEKLHQNNDQQEGENK